MKIYLFAILFLLCHNLLNAQYVRFHRTYGTLNVYDYGYDVKQTADGSYIIVGSTQSLVNGNSDILLIKLDKSGNKKWSKTFGGEYSDVGRSIQITADGNYAIAGYTNSFDSTAYQYYLANIDTSGQLIWQKTYGAKDWNLAYDMTQTPDGGYLLAGVSYAANNGDAWVVKTNAAGDTLWTKRYGTKREDVVYSICKISNYGFAMAGYTTSMDGGHKDFYVVRADVNGDTLWTKTFGDTLNDQVNSIVESTDGGGLVVCGSSENPYIKACIAKLNDTTGAVIWNNRFDNPYDSQALKIIQTSPGGYAFTGSYDLSPGNRDVYYFQTDSWGNWIDAGSFGYSWYEIGNSLVETSDGGYIIVGQTDSYKDNFSDVYVMKTDDIWNAGVYNSISEFVTPLPQVSTFPNPVKDDVNFVLSTELQQEPICVQIFDVAGRIFKEAYFLSGQFTLNLRTDDLAKGFYLYRLISSNTNTVLASGKIVVD